MPSLSEQFAALKRPVDRAEWCCKHESALHAALRGMEARADYMRECTGSNARHNPDVLADLGYRIREAQKDFDAATSQRAEDV